MVRGLHLSPAVPYLLWGRVMGDEVRMCAFFRCSQPAEGDHILCVDHVDNHWGSRRAPPEPAPPPFDWRNPTGVELSPTTVESYTAEEFLDADETADSASARIDARVSLEIPL